MAQEKDLEAELHQALDRTLIAAVGPVVADNLKQRSVTVAICPTQGFVMNNGGGGPANSTLFYNLYLYQQGFNQFNMGYASAMAWTLLVIIAVFTAITFFTAKYWVNYDS